MKKHLFFLILAFPLLATAQFSESFDGTTLPSTWTVVNQGDAKTWQEYTYYAGYNPVNPKSGTGFVGIEYSTSAHSDYLISPAFAVTSGVSDKVSFWAKNTGSAFAEQFDLKLSTTTADPSAFTTTIASNIKPINTSWVQYSYDLSAYAGQTVYLAFYISTTNQWFVGIDDFSVYGNLAVHDSKKLDGIKIYPNPVRDIMKIQNNTNEKISEVSIYAVTGQKIKTINNANISEADLSNLKAGVYIVNLKNADGEVKTIKFMKQ